MEFFINKYSYSNGENIDLSDIPMMTRRKLSPVGKIGISTMMHCYSGGEPNLVYASRYGELERVVKLISQKEEENEVSPFGFSFSVHNSTVGLFSLINKIHSKYNSVSAGKDTFYAGLLAAILNQSNTLYCYAESIDRFESISVLLGKEKKENSINVICKSNYNNLPFDGSNDFIDFLENKRKKVVSSDGLYVLERINS